MSDEAFVEQIKDALADDRTRRIYVYTEDDDPAPGWIEGVEVVDDEIRVRVAFP